MAVQRTYVYVDGFNVYYQALRGTPHKWLNIEALVQALLGPDNRIDMIRYFTAPVSGKLDPDQPIRQDRYLRALRTLLNLTVHLGNFISKPKVRPLETPLADGTTKFASSTRWRKAQTSILLPISSMTLSRICTTWRLC